MSQQRAFRNDLTGKRSGLLVGIERVGTAKGGNAIWTAQCDCGNIIKINTGNFGIQQSCGCVLKKRMAARATHGYTRQGKRPSEYVIWAGIIRRCHGIGHPRYSGRGISVCDRWRFGDGALTGLGCFVADMGPRPSNKHSVDRYPNNDGNYEPSNCRWATGEEQGRNKSNNHVVEFQGRKMAITAAAEAAGLNPNTVFGRIKLGWTEDEALNTPLCHPPYGLVKEAGR